MKTSFKHAVLSVICASALSTVFAIDYGGMISNDSKLAGNDFDSLLLDQKNGLTGWIRVPFTTKGTTYFSAEGLAQFERKDIDIFNNFDDVDAVNASVLDVNLFKFATTVETDASKITLSVGRFFTADVSGIVFSQNADGLLVSYESPVLTASAYAAYTGLLNGRTVSIIDPSFSEDTDKLYQTAGKYGVGAVTFSLPNLFANQTIAAQFLATFHTEDETYTRLYAEAAATGPLVSTIFYTLNTTFGFAQYDDGDMEVANVTKGALTYYAPFKNATVAINGVYASGEQGPFKSFQGFTSQTAVNALSGRTEYYDLVKAGIAASIKPVKNVLIGATADAIFDAADSIDYEGFQYGLNANWQIVSDVSVGALLYQYFDNDNSDRNKSCVQLKAAISF